MAPTSSTAQSAYDACAAYTLGVAYVDGVADASSHRFPNGNAVVISDTHASSGADDVADRRADSFPNSDAVVFSDTHTNKVADDGDYGFPNAGIGFTFTHTVGKGESS